MPNLLEILMITAMLTIGAAAVGFVIVFLFVYWSEK